MWSGPLPVRIEIIIEFKFILLLLLIISPAVHGVEADASVGLLSSSESSAINLSRKYVNDSEQAKLLLLESNLSKSPQANESIDKSVYDVHVYVSNKDNERLKVSLFIDSELKDTKDISSDSELKMNSYPLSRGPHSFKITWWDEDVKKSYEIVELKEIQEETSVNLYTSSHKAPEKFEISVKLTNENRNELDAYLYVDGSFEKSKVVGKESTTELGTIKLEEGVHNLSVRWQDKDTRIEYGKTKKITVTKDDATVFYAPQGISFDAKQSPVQQEKAVYSGGNKETASLTKEDAIEKSTLTKDTSNVTNEVLSKSITKAETKFSNLRESTTYASEKNPLTGGAMGVSDKTYLYAILVIVAVYLMQRH